MKEQRILVTETNASELLRKRFFSAEQVISVWNRIIGERRAGHQISPLGIPSNLAICYSLNTIYEANKNSTWYLVYDPGFSLRDILVILGSNHKYQPRHLHGNDWWHLPEEINLWTGERKEGNYYLIRMKPFLRNIIWREQEEALHREGKIYRATSRLIVCARLTYFLINKEYIFPECDNWGPELLPPDTEIACVSGVGEKGFTLYGWHCGQNNQNFGVYPVRKFDF